MSTQFPEMPFFVVGLQAEAPDLNEQADSEDLYRIINLTIAIILYMSVPFFAIIKCSFHSVTCLACNSVQLQVLEAKGKETSCIVV